jgi:hypothetical protein
MTYRRVHRPSWGGNESCPYCGELKEECPC